MKSCLRGRRFLNLDQWADWRCLSGAKKGFQYLPKPVITGPFTFAMQPICGTCFKPAIEPASINSAPDFLALAFPCRGAYRHQLPVVATGPRPEAEVVMPKLFLCRSSAVSLFWPIAAAGPPSGVLADAVASGSSIVHYLLKFKQPKCLEKNPLLAQACL